MVKSEEFARKTMEITISAICLSPRPKELTSDHNLKSQLLYLNDSIVAQ